MAKFDNIKVGDKVYDIMLKEWGVVSKVLPEQVYSVEVDFSETSRSYTQDGMNSKEDKTPSLYWNEVKLPTDEEDKKPFDLVACCKEYLEPAEFVEGGNNECIYYSHVKKYWVVDNHYDVEYITPYFKINLKILPELNRNKITPQQLKSAFKELGWI